MIKIEIKTKKHFIRINLYKCRDCAGIWLCLELSKKNKLMHIPKHNGICIPF